jgi:hypothetical protein
MENDGNMTARVRRSQVLGESGDAQGQTVLRVRDAAGAVIELTLDTAAHVVGVRVVSPAPGTKR